MTTLVISIQETLVACGVISCSGQSVSQVVEPCWVHNGHYGQYQVSISCRAEATTMGAGER